MKLANLSDNVERAGLSSDKEFFNFYDDGKITVKNQTVSYRC